MNRRAFPLAIASIAVAARPLAAEDARTILAKVAELYPSLHSYAFEGTAITEMTKEASHTPITPFSIRALNSSPTANFERLMKTAENPTVLRSETMDIAGKMIQCDAGGIPLDWRG